MDIHYNKSVVFGNKCLLTKGRGPLIRSGSLIASRLLTLSLCGIISLERLDQ